MATEDMIAKCSKCSNGIKDKQIQCDVCAKWFHLGCTEVTETLYKAMSKLKGGAIKWFCPECDKSVGNILPSVLGAKQQQDKFEKDMIEVKSELKELNKEKNNQKAELKDLQERFQAEVDGVKKEVGEVGKDVKEHKQQFSEIAKKGLTVEQLAADPGRMMAETNTRNQERDFQVKLTEAMERDKRKNNLVIMGIDESKNEQETKEFVEEIFSKLLEHDMVEYEVKGRIGKVRDKCRPVRVEVINASGRRQIMKKAKTLKEDRKFEKIFVSPDLTRKQQEENKTLRDKLKEFRNQGMLGIKISKGCIVREQGNSREVLYGADQ